MYFFNEENQPQKKETRCHRFFDLDREERDFEPMFPRLFDFDFDFDLDFDLERALDNGCFLLRPFDFDLDDRGGNFSGN